MTQPPSGEQVAVATNALRTEAGEWDAQAGKLGELSAKVAGMEFGRLEAVLEVFDDIADHPQKDGGDHGSE